VGEGETDSRLDVIVCVLLAPCSLSQILSQTLSKTLSVVEGSVAEGARSRLISGFMLTSDLCGSVVPSSLAPGSVDR